MAARLFIIYIKSCLFTLEDLKTKISKTKYFVLCFVLCFKSKTSLLEQAAIFLQQKKIKFSIKKNNLELFFDSFYEFSLVLSLLYSFSLIQCHKNIKKSFFFQVLRNL